MTGENRWCIHLTCPKCGHEGSIEESVPDENARAEAMVQRERAIEAERELAWYRDVRLPEVERARDEYRARAEAASLRLCELLGGA